MIGHTAHVNILKDIDILFTLLLKMEECFKD